ncbi:MAG: hypothetical protein J5809_06830 [Selenomonadaceae bacterium]|nr:hypothetical protein [Selenomonadaceae bacterium]
MNTKKFAVASALIFLHGFTAVNAAPLDDELAQISAEQQNSSDRVEIFDPNPEPTVKAKTESELREEQKRLEEERKAARKKIDEERQKARDEISGKAPISKNPIPPERTERTAAEPVTPTPAETENQPAVGLPNPVTTYASFDEIVRAMNFTPLYVPKKSGYTISSITSIGDRLAEIRYGRRWEPAVSLHVRTYRRADGEELKDVSGVTGVKWRTNVVNGITVYIAKIDENNHVAAWAVGNYTFSAYVENLSFAAFHSFVSDELVDLSQHYYLTN